MTELDAGNGARQLPFDRDVLGRFVREAWVRWAQTQPEPKSAWLVPYDELDEPDREADRQIGEAVARWTLIGDAARHSLSAPEAGAEPVAWLYRYRHNWNAAHEQLRQASVRSLDRLIDRAEQAEAALAEAQRVIAENTDSLWYKRQAAREFELKQALAEAQRERDEALADKNGAEAALAALKAMLPPQPTEAGADNVDGLEQFVDENNRHWVPLREAAAMLSRLRDERQEQDRALRITGASLTECQRELGKAEAALAEAQREWVEWEQRCIDMAMEPTEDEQSNC